VTDHRLLYCAACHAAGEALRAAWEPTLRHVRRDLPPLRITPAVPTGRCLACDAPLVAS
jgi:hypothetical protein